jgi:hypothetical protein
LNTPLPVWVAKPFLMVDGLFDHHFSYFFKIKFQR